MRTRLLALTAALALVVPATSYAADSVVTDACGETTDQVKDLTRAELHYSATSFQVRSENCEFSNVEGNWWITFHLTSFTPEVQITGAINDFGTFSGWSGFYFCKALDCPVDGGAFPVTPPGVRLAGSDYYDNLDDPALSGRSAYGFGGWDRLLNGVVIPSTIDFYVTVHQLGTQLDRAPDNGFQSVSEITITRPSSVAPGSVDTAPFSAPGGAYPVVVGLLHYDSPNGPWLPNRLATLYSAAGTRLEEQYYGGVDFDASGIYPDFGEFATGTRVMRNTTLKAGFDGDGFTDPSPLASVKALVSAFVSLDLPSATTVRRGQNVRFHGVVRPAAPGSNVLVQARSGGAGAPWRNWRTVPLQTTGDTFYSFTWTPATAGTTTFRVVWQHGTTADGGVVNGISNYATIRVT